MSNCHVTLVTKFTEGHQYRHTDGLVGTGIMPYKAKFTRNMIFEAVY